VSKLVSLSALHGVAVPGRFGKANGDAGVTLAERTDLGIATVAVRKGQEAALKSAVRESYGLDLPEGSTAVKGKEVLFIGTGPGQWLAVSASLENEKLAENLATKLKGLASISDQSSGRAVVRITGPRARDVLAKGLAIDLDPGVFGPNGAVTSTISHMGVVLWRDGQADGYDVALFRSMAGSFWHWLTASAAEYGYEVKS
jgi:methylglutamate dehydrogenase subunit D